MHADLSNQSYVLALLRKADCCALHRESQNTWQQQANLLHRTIPTAIKVTKYLCSESCWEM